MEAMVPNPGQPTIGPGATGDVVRRLQRALRRTPDLGISVDGVFGLQSEAAVKSFQEGAGLLVDGIVGPLTWNALPDGGPMPVLREGSSGAVVQSLQRVLTNGAPGEWGTTPQGIDGIFGSEHRALYGLDAVPLTIEAGSILAEANDDGKELSKWRKLKK
jgi:peptidoglycan hydrolase-like protein with peptidoglycan-binding domain